MFSVIIPYYKKRQYIERCLDSVLNQSFQNFEIILVDDGSDDDLEQIVNLKYKDKLKLIRQVNQGVSAARNRGISNATHDYIAFLDADDYWSPAYLQKNAEIIKKEATVKIIGSHYTRNKSEIELGPSDLNYFEFKNYWHVAIRNTYFTSSSTIINRSFFLQNPGFNSNLKRGEDLDVWFRTVASGGKSFFINNTLVYYSDEDQNQATKKVFNLEDSIIYRMKDEYNLLAEQYSNPELKKFAERFIRSRLLSYYFQKESHGEARKLMEKIGKGSGIARLIYSLPVKWGSIMLSTQLGRKFVKIVFR